MIYSLVDLKKVSLIIKNKKILDNISLSLKTKEIIAIIGASGSGKTSLLKLILDLLFEEKGWEITGKIIKMPGLKIAYIQQNSCVQIFKNFVYEEFACEKEEAKRLLALMDSEYLLEKRCLLLSHGEKTIVAILRALSYEVSILVLDEVMVNLSANKRLLLKKIITNFKKQGGSVVMVEHAELVIKIADKVVLLENKKLKPINNHKAKLFFAPSFDNQKVIIKQCSAPPDLILKNIDVLDKRISAKANKGEIIGISGDNGSGKSTLIEIICGIKKQKYARIIYCGKKLKNLSSRKNLIALTTQESMQQFLTSTVRDEISGCEDKKQIIKLFHLDKFLNRNINNLSYGEKQRLAIALSILSEAPILIFDEPTYGMDKFTFNAFIKAINLAASNNRIIIISSHEIHLLKKLTKNIIKL